MPQSGTRSVLPTLVRNGSDRSGVVPCSLRRPKALENAVRLLYHKSKQTTFAGARQCPALPQQGLLMVQCSPYRKATLSGNRAAARFGAYHRAGHGGYYTTRRCGAPPSLVRNGSARSGVVQCSPSRRKSWISAYGVRLLHHKALRLAHRLP